MNVMGTTAEKRHQWRRFLAEAATIVGSILLAFWIDATWEERRERADAAALIELIRADLQANISSMEDSNVAAETILTAASELRALVLGEAPSPGADSLAALESGTRAGSDFRPTLASYDVGRGSSAWKYIPTSVQAELARYLSGHLQVEIDIQVQAIVGLSDIAAPYGGGFGAISALTRDSGGIEALMRQPEYWNWLGLNEAVVWNGRRWRLGWIDRLRAIDEQLGGL